ncbi:uncharacterized protein [Eurosta solidaginis]|uniref:uncharacterized protein n=1 Tax=Eurosta solidaginis TaxID=178769 RepID=UPI003530F9CC
MTTDKTVAEIEWVKGTLLPELLKSDNFKEDNGLSDVIYENVKLDNVKVKFIGPEEAFMLTSCYRAVITFEYADGGPKTTKLVVKRTPNLPQHAFESLQFEKLFSNEINAYKTIMPALEKFSQQTINKPRFYYGDLGENYATLVLQDFDMENWRICKQKVNLSLGHTLVAIRNLGTFHGIGFALRHKNRAEFDRITKDLKETRYERKTIHPNFQIQITTSAERVVIATKKYQPHVDSEFLERYKRLTQEYVLFGRQMVKPVEPFVTLCHGDYLRNNIAFKYSENSEEPNDSLTFDLQTMRLCSPMLDFVTFLSLSCYTATRYEYFDQIFEEYYNQLTKTFKENTEVAETPDYLSPESLLSEYRRYLPCGLSSASFFLMQLVEPLQLTSEEFIMRKLSLEEQRQDVLTRGGEVVDRELSNQMKELYDFVQKNGLNIFKSFDYV